jgi:hypothetical protein
MAPDQLPSQAIWMCSAYRLRGSSGAEMLRLRLRMHVAPDHLPYCARVGDARLVIVVLITAATDRVTLRAGARFATGQRGRPAACGFSSLSARCQESPTGKTARMRE